MIPCADGFNHADQDLPQNNAYWHYNLGKDMLTITAKSDIKTGEEVFVSYGKRSNPQLFSLYGFVMPKELEPFQSFRCWNYLLRRIGVAIEPWYAYDMLLTVPELDPMVLQFIEQTRRLIASNQDVPFYRAFVRSVVIRETNVTEAWNAAHVDAFLIGRHPLMPLEGVVNYYLQQYEEKFSVEKLQEWVGHDLKNPNFAEEVRNKTLDSKVQGGLDSRYDNLHFSEYLALRIHKEVCMRVQATPPKLNYRSTLTELPAHHEPTIQRMINTLWERKLMTVHRNATLPEGVEREDLYVPFRIDVSGDIDVPYPNMTAI